MQNRRTFLTRSSLAFGAVTFLRPLTGLAGGGGKSTTGNTLTILFTSGAAKQQSNDPDRWRTLRQAIRNARGEGQPVLLLDTGNNLSTGTQKSIGDLHTFSALKENRYDAVVPGDADMQHGTEYFSKLVDKSRITAIATNYPGGVSQSTLTWQTVRKGGIKVGIIGIGSMDNLNAASYADTVAAINSRALQLKQKQHCHLVVCLSYLPLKNEKNQYHNLQLSQHSANVDVVISANDSRFTYNTHVVKNKEGFDVVVSHVEDTGLMLGRLDIGFNEAGEKTGVTSQLVFTGASHGHATAFFKKHAAAQMNG